jgi:hypothetical protein
MLIWGITRTMRAQQEVTLQEAEMADSVALLALQSKLARTATYRQLQALSSALMHLTNGSLTLSSFVLPSGATVRPVAVGEVRLSRIENGHFDLFASTEQTQRNTVWSHLI